MDILSNHGTHGPPLAVFAFPQCIFSSNWHCISGSRRWAICVNINVFLYVLIRDHCLMWFHWSDKRLSLSLTICLCMMEMYSLKTWNCLGGWLFHINWIDYQALPRAASNWHTKTIWCVALMIGGKARTHQDHSDHCLVQGSCKID